MLKKFLRDKEGQFAIITAIAALPLFGGVAMAIDFSNLSRLRHDLKDSCDASNIEVAKSYMAGGKTKAQLEQMSRKMFDVNFDEQYLNKSVLQLTLPDDPGNVSKKLELECKLTYETMFGPVLAGLTRSDVDNYSYVIEVSTMKMKNVAEIALVLDNSGSMAWNKSGQSGAPLANQRITLLKQASKQLVTTMIELGTKIHQVSNPVKFSLVPFSASVNVGANNATAAWMDTRGISPIHHEHLNWGTASPVNPTGFRNTAPDGAKLDGAGNPLTRFSILNALKWQAGGSEDTSKCHVWKNGQTTTGGSGNPNCSVFARSGAVTAVSVTSDAAATAINTAAYNKAWAENKYKWAGCVEARPGGLDLTDDAPNPGTPGTYFVPMFAPDAFVASKYGTSTVTDGHNNWWPDFETGATFRLTDPTNIGNGYWLSPADGAQSTPTATNLTTSSWWASTSRPREVDVAKYFVNKPYLSGSGTPGSTSATRKGQWQYFRDESGPNHSCTTKAITPLTGSESALHAAIDAMAATGNTNVPEGLAWGWRTVSSAAPFTEGVAESRKDIDKVVIVLTDGANTYADLANSAGNDVSGTKTTYGAYGFTGYAGNAGTNGTAAPSSALNKPRMYAGTSASSTTHDDANFQKAMDDRMIAICDNIKDKDVILMTVALDLDPANYASASDKAAVNKAIQTLTNCAGESKTRSLANGDPAKLFWNAKSDTLDDTFKEIADELSNLRFTM